MQSYLPKEAGPSSGFSEGGGLYALGLIHANHGTAIIDYLLSQLKEAQNEMVRHGGCLGLGLAAMGTNRQDVYEQLKFNLYQDDAVTGEAAGIAMGMVMLGSKSTQAIEDMVAYAQETQHEKILRGLAVGIALNMYGRLEEADALIESLCRDKDPILRRSGMYTITMAYCGTGSNQAIRRLLHVAVSDVNDDVRRAAVTGLGFLLFRTPEQCPSVVSLLAESYNPHVRYGAAMALGIACAGTGLKEAIALLDPMTNDPVNFVRQGALIASAMILIQHTEQTCPKVKDFRTLYSKVIVDKHEDVMAKFGAILAQGIIDAGWQTNSFPLFKHVVMKALPLRYMYVFKVLALFYRMNGDCDRLVVIENERTQLTRQISQQLARCPKVNCTLFKKSFLFLGPKFFNRLPLDIRILKSVTTAVLSIAARQRRRGGSSKQSAADSAATASGSGAASTSGGSAPAAAEKMEVDEAKVEEVEKKKEEEKEEKKKKEEKAKQPEPNFEVLANPARVMKQQLKVISLLDASGSYVPLKEVGIGGIVMMRRGGPGAAGGGGADDEEQLVEPVAAFGPKPDDDKEPEPPEPFEYTDD
ncbi:hypothetical protein LSTR_LSTR010779 [Laodelphax striatellus]|uniref:26S proteasome regulatory subunit RPN2 C-terminal domain-containing protein n=1 Tax=Laodelphax striatellus TaxID=195883 RepID=A0A482XDC3_LAOST|nr:hypothetical protein LSTR_LSTR010779 [Laodelphax striatellus]